MQTEASNVKPLIGTGGLVSTGSSSRDPTCRERLQQAVERKPVCNLLISTVKELSGPSELKYSWKIISPGKRIYVLQAESEDNYKLWITTLRSEIEKSLSNVVTEDAHTSQAGASSSLSPYLSGAREMSNDKDIRDTTIESTIVLSEEQQKALVTVNKYCADCGRENPEWASVNNGIMICIECCGVHRSLGTHISKVRSLKLDRWTPNSVQLLLLIGNKRFNDIYERVLQDDEDGGAAALVKPRINSQRDERANFVNSKVITCFSSNF